MSSDTMDQLALFPPPVDVDYGEDDQQRLIRETTARFLRERVPADRVRRAVEARVDGHADTEGETLAKELAEMGWLGIGAEEARGGLGLGTVEESIVAEELGRARAPIAWDGQVVATHLLASLGEDDLVAGAVTGDVRPRVAGSLSGAASELRLHAGRVTGQALVLGGVEATHLVVVARDQNGEVGLAVLATDAAGVTLEAERPLDATRSLARAQVDVATEVRTGAGDLVDAARDRAWTLQAADALGGSSWALELALAHAKQRMQFGRPIGSFQAVKHKLADMLVHLESARSAAMYAARAAGTSDASLAAAVAKDVAASAYTFISGECIQIHGGIGFTWEHDAHFAFKRARVLANADGGVGAARRLVAAALRG